MILKPLPEKKPEKNSQLGTRGIFNCRDSGNLKVCTSIKNLCKLTMNYFEIGN